MSAAPGGSSWTRTTRATAPRPRRAQPVSTSTSGGHCEGTRQARLGGSFSHLVVSPFYVDEPIQPREAWRRAPVCAESVVDFEAAIGPSATKETSVG